MFEKLIVLKSSGIWIKVKLVWNNSGYVGAECEYAKFEIIAWITSTRSFVDVQWAEDLK